ncbi:MAG: class I SAM-dependent methyltransferase [Promethearchaeota archaeon]|jgi:2-polyprenyl-3-methyl-5-hydroxy-6-metoxy-1,4-benzoquinol methylase
MNYEEAINTQYGQSDLGNKILTTLQREGIYTAKGIKDALAPIEELHLGGSLATLKLAQKANLDKTMRVLDIGCGIGGPARNLATNFGCHVTGIDLSEEYCRAADMINEYLGLKGSIEIMQGNALSMPFDTTDFDVVFIQHVLMNIKNKEQLISRVNTILSPNGRLALNTICAGSVTPIHFPVIFASDPDISFLLTASELRQLIRNGGFKELAWNDVTTKLLEGIQRRRSKPRVEKPRSTIPELIFSNVSAKWRNGVRNLKEDRWAVIQGIFERV